ncbi:hypothetical protein [Streptomyces sp. NPDC096033]|uniref:hypothetical protein n=1 Tax=Streptomyces sp. NPDC096033 TaxID=3366071 RepID=UPI0037F24F50
MSNELIATVRVFITVPEGTATDEAALQDLWLDLETCLSNEVSAGTFEDLTADSKVRLTFDSIDVVSLVPAGVPANA